MEGLEEFLQGAKEMHELAQELRAAGKEERARELERFIQEVRFRVSAPHAPDFGAAEEHTGLQ